MIHETIKSFLNAAIASTVKEISNYTVCLDADLLRTKKLLADKLLSFRIFQGSSSTKNELFDFHSLDANGPSNSAYKQQCAKLTSEALQYAP